MSESLRNIGENYLAVKDELLNTIDEETGEVNTEVLERLNAIQENFESKAQNVSLVCLELKDKRELIENEIERLQKLLNRAKTAEKWLKDYLAYSMTSAGIERIDSVRVSISFRNSEETIIDNLEDIPKEYVKEKVTYTADKAAIKAAIKSGQEIAGAHIEKKKNLQIR